MGSHPQFVKVIQDNYSVKAVLTYTSGAKEYHYIPFNTDVTDWQFISLAIIPQREETVSTIQVVCAYEQNINSAQFDNISLIREVAQQMAYDDNGMLLSVTSTDQATDKDTYNGYRLLTKRETAGSGTYTYKYNDPNNSYRISSSTNGLVTESFTYNTNGNLLSTTLSGSGG